MSSITRQREICFKRLLIGDIFPHFLLPKQKWSNKLVRGLSFYTLKAQTQVDHWKRDKTVLDEAARKPFTRREKF